MADEFYLKIPDFHVTFRDLLHAVNLWHGKNGFTSLPKEGVLRIFFALKNPTASAGFEPANLGTKSQHATSRPPKPLSVTTPMSVQNGLHCSVPTIVGFSKRNCCRADNVIISPYSFSGHHAFPANLQYRGVNLKHLSDRSDNQAYAGRELFYSKLFV